MRGVFRKGLMDSDSCQHAGKAIWKREETHDTVEQSLQEARGSGIQYIKDRSQKCAQMLSLETKGTRIVPKEPVDISVYSVLVFSVK